MHPRTGSIVGLIIALASVLAASGQGTPAAAAAPSLLVYHQITAFPEESGGFMYPVLSGDGTRAAFSRFVVSEDPAVYGTTSVFALNADGTGLAEVDTYETLCHCDALVDLSDDGQTVVSSDGVQLRIAGVGGARELLPLADIGIGAVRITSDARAVYFTVHFDTSTRDGGQELGRGVWAIDAAGGDPRQVVSAEDVAEAIAVPVEATDFNQNVQWLDVSDDGGLVAFGAFAFDFYEDERHYLFTVPGDGGAMRPLLGPVAHVGRVAISGDGATVAYDVAPPGAASWIDNREVGVLGADGGEPQVLLTGDYGGVREDRLQLSADGSRLLVAPDGLLLDTASGAAWQLAVQTPGTHPDPLLLIADGLEAATMNADATRFLYVMARADWITPNPRQLATIDLDPVDLGDAPFISGPAIAPTALPLDGETAATASAYVEAEGGLIGLGLVALRDGRVDDNLYAQLFDDGGDGDAEAGDSIFSAQFHPFLSAEEDQAGPRMLRIEAEIETSDGLRHATAVEFGPLVLNQAP